MATNRNPLGRSDRTTRYGGGRKPVAEAEVDADEDRARARGTTGRGLAGPFTGPFADLFADLGRDARNELTEDSPRRKDAETCGDPFWFLPEIDEDWFEEESEQEIEVESFMAVIGETSLEMAQAGHGVWIKKPDPQRRCASNTGAVLLESG